MKGTQEKRGHQNAPKGNADSTLWRCGICDTVFDHPYQDGTCAQVCPICGYPYLWREDPS